MQTALVLLIFAAAAAYIFRRFYRSLHAKGGCGCGCSDCKCNKNASCGTHHA